jgi:uncharacterized protein (DUF2062 family)
MLSRAFNSFRQRAHSWLRQGVTPRRLALTLSLGFAIGCFPVLGVTTFFCAVLALALRLNLPAIQAANYAAMPFQIALLVPFVRLGGWIFTSGPRAQVNLALLRHSSPLAFFTQMGHLTALALGGWLLLAVPTVLMLTAALTPLLRHLPQVAATEAAD